MVNFQYNCFYTERFYTVALVSEYYSLSRFELVLASNEVFHQKKLIQLFN